MSFWHFICLITIFHKITLTSACAKFHQKMALLLSLNLHRQRSRHVTRQQLTQLAFRPPFLGLFTKIQTSIWSEFSGQKGMPCFASSLLDSNRRQRALQILNGPTGQEIKILVETAWAQCTLKSQWWDFGTQ